jgi:cytochrome P450
MNRAFSLTVNLPPGAPRPPEYLAAEREASQVIGEMISERRTRPRDKDFVSALLAGQSQSGALSDAEIAANIFGICIAGQGTTSITSATMLMNLCKHREQFNQVISDPKLIPQTVEEALRYQGPGFFGFPRFAVRDCEVGGTPVLKGMPVLGSQQAAGWDPDVFPEPERFDIHRKPKNILTFGSGRHHCLGNRLARQVLCIVLEKVCLRFPNLRLQDPAFEPHYEGMFGEVKPSSIPMHTGL